MNNLKGVIIAIDGPSGSGKSTLANMLAKKLSGQRIDTGATYRAVAFYALKKNVSTESACSKIAQNLTFDYSKDGKHFLVNGKNLNIKIRSEKVSKAASIFSQYKMVRAVLTRKQKSLALRYSKTSPVIVEGRDIGTVVFPRAKFKFFITADESTRAKRRLNQLTEQGKSRVNLKKVLKNNLGRDRRDSNRKVAPLVRAKNAVLIDTSQLTLGEVLLKMLRAIRK